MKRLCDVPKCLLEATEEVANGYMCRWHAIQWDKANKAGDVYVSEEFIGLDDPENDVAADECQSKWLGKHR